MCNHWLREFLSSPALTAIVNRTGRGVAVEYDPPVLPVSWSTIRLFIHLLAATVWVGGQLVVAGLVPGLRQLDPDLPRAVARRFAAIAWPAFAVLIVTGMWNLLEAPITWDGRYGATLVAKITVVTASGLSASPTDGPAQAGPWPPSAPSPA